MSAAESPLSPIVVARQLAAKLDDRQVEYAFGGAIALAFWGEPRMTDDVDLILFLPPEKPSECVRLLHEVGCELSAAGGIESIIDHGFCRAVFAGTVVDVFLPSNSFYEVARARRRQVMSDGQSIMIWDAETLAFFKMLFFRPQDFLDIETMLVLQKPHFDRGWVRKNLVEMYGERDPRVARWDELVRQVPVE
jgi:hypothetical protein